MPSRPGNGRIPTRFPGTADRSVSRNLGALGKGLKNDGEVRRSGVRNRAPNTEDDLRRITLRLEAGGRWMLTCTGHPCNAAYGVPWHTYMCNGAYYPGDGRIEYVRGGSNALYEFHGTYDCD